MADNRAKAVSAKLIDKVSTNFSLRSLLTPMLKDGLKKFDSIEIPTRSAVQIEQVSTGTGAASMTVQTNVASPNTLIADQHYGSIIEIGEMNDIFDLEGSWSDQLASQVLTELGDYMDIDVYARALIFGGAWAAGTSAPSTWVNAAGAALTQDMIEQALAVMLSQKGVRYEDLAFAFHPFGMGSVRRLSAYTPISTERQASGQAGMPMVGSLLGVPVYISQSVPNQRVIATSAVTIASNVATATVLAGHGLVPGQYITTQLHTTNATTAVQITETTATTVVYPLTASNGALADGVGTITANLTVNGLIAKPWAFLTEGKVPKVKVVPRSGGKIVDELQSSAVWGSKGLPGCFVAIGSPRNSFT